MNKTTEMALFVLDQLDDIIDELRDADGESVAKFHQIYNKQMNRLRRKLWRKFIRPQIEDLDLENQDWLDDVGDMVDVVRIVLRRWG